MLIPDVLLVLFTECLVDWVKHAFITKFNEIPFEVYRDYTVSIAYDLAASRHKNVSVVLKIRRYESLDEWSKPVFSCRARILRTPVL